MKSLPIYPHPQKQTQAGVSIPTGGVMLNGDLEVPVCATGIVVFAHGSGSGRHSPRNQLVARLLREAGFGTLLLDLLTLHEELAEANTGELRFNIELLAQRLIGVTRWLEQAPATSDLGVAYFGASTGAGAALIAAAELGDRISAVVSRGGRPDLAANVLQFVRAPTLLLVGGYDESVIRLNQEAFAQLNCVKEMIIVPAATHLFEEPGKLEAVAQLSADWFQQYLPPIDEKEFLA